MNIMVELCMEILRMNPDYTWEQCIRIANEEMSNGTRLEQRP